MVAKKIVCGLPNSQVFAFNCDADRLVRCVSGPAASARAAGSSGRVRPSAPRLPWGPLTYIDGTCVEMLRAKTVRKNNTSGVPGVEWYARKQRWRATICFKGKRHYLGLQQNLHFAARGPDLEARQGKSFKKYARPRLNERDQA